MSDSTSFGNSLRHHLEEQECAVLSHLTKLLDDPLSGVLQLIAARAEPTNQDKRPQAIPASEVK